MFKKLKLWQLASALKGEGNSPEAFSAVLELGRLNDDKAAELLIEALARRDGVARNAARELGKMRNDRAILPLVTALDDPEISQAAAEALLGFGPKAVGPLMEALKSGNGDARERAAFALGELRDKRATEPLILVMQTDDVYAVRTAAATALGQLKDARAVWVLVATLRMRDETSPERQAALDHLRNATQLALRKIGDPLAVKAAAAPGTAQAALAAAEKKVAESGVHPRLAGDVKLLNQEELLEVIRELVNASEEISWAQLESREPLLPAYFKSYEQRSGIAEAVGRELYRRGGAGLLKRVLAEQLNGHTAIANWWSNIEGPAVRT
jgi:HEAT repeat protein